MDQYPPLGDRVVKTSGLGLAVAHRVPSASVYRGEYKQWSEERMALAVDAVMKDGISVRRAAEEYDVPKSTLGDRISGRILPGAVSGPGKYLSDQEEDELVCFLLECASIGYPRSRQEVIAIVQRLCDRNGIQKVVSHGWWESFCRRHRNLTLRVTAPLSLSRAKATDVGVINKYFDMLEATLLEYDLHDKPCQLFNIDETGMPLDPKPLRLVCGVGTKNPVAVGAGNKAQISVVGCVSAAGYCIPPMIIYGRKTLSREMVKDEIPGTLYGLSPKGWMDQELFDLWIDHFLHYAPPARPLLLLMDGHSSHYCPSAIHIASQHQVVLLALPPNTTHLAQPLDKGIFGPLKVEWRKLCHEYIIANPGKVVTHHCFSELFAKAWIRSMTMKNILASFRTCGVYPINRNKVMSHIELPSSPKPKAGGLTYLPLLTPTPGHRSDQKCIVPTFSDAEFELYHERLEKGYGGSDERYKLWLRMYHPDSVDIGDQGGVSLGDSIFHTPVKGVRATKPSTEAVALAKPSSMIEKIFSRPVPPSKLPTLRQKQSSRVLTSSENLRLLHEKEQKKEAAEQKKRERQKQREEKQASGKHVIINVYVGYVVGTWVLYMYCICLPCFISCGS